MVLALIVGSDFYCILPSQSAALTALPEGEPRGLYGLANSATNCDFREKYKKAAVRTK